MDCTVWPAEDWVGVDGVTPAHTWPEKNDLKRQYCLLCATLRNNISDSWRNIVMLRVSLVKDPLGDSELWATKNFHGSPGHTTESDLFGTPFQVLPQSFKVDTSIEYFADGHGKGGLDGQFGKQRR